MHFEIRFGQRSIHSAAILVAVAAIIFGPLTLHAGNASMNEDKLTVGQNPITAWVRAVDEAREAIWVVHYKLTSESALEALVAAHQRGVEIKIILDGEAARKGSSLASQAKRAGLDVTLWPTGVLGKLHTKFTVFDSQQAIFGSFNLTDSAELENTELFYGTENAEIVRELLLAWQNLYQLVETAKASGTR